MSRVLFIHAGGGKAGSSAIQSMLSLNAAKLKQAGIGYGLGSDQQSQYDVTSGNGMLLYQALHRPDWQSIGEGLLEQYMDGQQTAICSSEFLGSIKTTEWEKLLDCAQSIGIEIRIIYVVRAVLSFLISSYHQRVKRHGEFRSLEEYLKTADWSHYNDLNIINRSFSKDKIHIINYDNSDDIFKSFLMSDNRLKYISEFLTGRTPKVNRSLSESELYLLRKVNCLSGDQFSQNLSDYLIYKLPEHSSTFSVSRKMVRTMEIKFRDEILWMNETFLSERDDEVLLISDVTINDDDFQEYSVDNRELDDTLDSVLEWALERLSSTHGNEIRFICSRLLAIDWENRYHPEIPADFDPFAYLFINVDVLEAGVPPYGHYISTGKLETRPYKWFPKTIPDETGDQLLFEGPVVEIDGVFNEAAKIKFSPSDLKTRYELERLVRTYHDREMKNVDRIRQLIEETRFNRSETLALQNEILDRNAQSIEQIDRKMMTQTEAIIDLFRTFREPLDNIAASFNEWPSRINVLNQVHTRSLDALEQHHTFERTALIQEARQNDALIESYRNAKFLTRLRWLFLGIPYSSGG